MPSKNVNWRVVGAVALTGSLLFGVFALLTGSHGRSETRTATGPSSDAVDQTGTTTTTRPGSVLTQPPLQTTPPPATPATSPPITSAPPPPPPSTPPATAARVPHLVAQESSDGHSTAKFTVNGPWSVDYAFSNGVQRASPPSPACSLVIKVVNLDGSDAGLAKIADAGQSGQGHQDYNSTGTYRLSVGLSCPNVDPYNGSEIVGRWSYRVMG